MPVRLVQSQSLVVVLVESMIDHKSTDIGLARLHQYIAIVHSTNLQLSLVERILLKYSKMMRILKTQHLAIVIMILG